ncbi:hypothetical protein LBJG_01699 [Lactobacillus jensenii 1153]|nr:hypothetical protein LBJG_01699 [Lactobacillus jensenii 1153]
MVALMTYYSKTILYKTSRRVDYYNKQSEPLQTGSVSADVLANLGIVFVFKKRIAKFD